MVGQTVSHDRILEKLGEGGMGQVYLVQDTSLERKVALKFLPTSLHTDPVAHKRFRREAKAAAIEHPYICNIKEVSQTDDGQDYIVMEYVEGQTLRERSEKGRLPLREALRLATGFYPRFFSSEHELVIYNPEELAAVSLEKSGRSLVGGEIKRLKADSYLFPALSPDGNWIVYTDAGTDEEENQRWEIYVSPWPSLEQRFQMSVGGGEEPRSNPEGTEIVYRSVREGIPKQGSDR